MRVTENTARSTVGESLQRTRSKVDTLQQKTATQKRILVPSDDPAANTKIMDIRTQNTIHSQYDSNAGLAKNRLMATDSALGELYDLFTRAKEIALNQSSAASANGDSRIGVAQEVAALYKQLVSVSNRRFGEHYIFSGFKTLTSPYKADGTYNGDDGEMKIEVQKDVHIPINIPGPTVFEVKRFKPEEKGLADAGADKTEVDTRGIAQVGSREAPIPVESQEIKPLGNINLFKELDSLRVGLLTNDTVTIRDTLESFDEVIRNIITLRTKMSARVTAVDAANTQTNKMDVANAELMTRLEDADYADLWASLAKEETVLRSSLSAAQKLIQPSLLDFLK